MSEIIDELESSTNNSNNYINNSQNENLPVLNDIISLNKDQYNRDSSAIDYTSNEETGIPSDVHKSENENIDNLDNMQLIKLNNGLNETQPLKNEETIDASCAIQIPMSSDDVEKAYKKSFPYAQSTLDEPISTTIKRDLFLIFTKIKFVVNPFGKKKDKNYYIRKWDLWGPLLLNILLACTLAVKSQQKSQIIILVFVIFWFGGILVYLNANFLGMKTSIFQLLCLFGYCQFPLNLSAIISLILRLSNFPRLILVGLTCVWSVYASGDFLKGLASPDQRYLVLYPLILFYIYIAWFIFTNN